MWLFSVSFSIIYASFSESLGFKMFQVERVWSLDRKSESSAPNLSWCHTKCSWNTEQNCVIILLVKAVVHEECAWTSIYVWPWVADFTSLLQLLGDNFIVCFYEINKIAILDIFFCKGEFAHKSWVSFSKNCMTVSWDDFSRFKSLGNEISDILLSPVISVLFLEVENEIKALLIGETMEWSG